MVTITRRSGRNKQAAVSPLVYPPQFLMNPRFRVGLGLFVIAAIPRLLGAFFLPNTFGDAYVYIRDIGNLSTKIKTGIFAVTDLYGFWLPLYQLIAAAINVFVGNGFYSGKVVAALFGVGVCLLVYALTRQLVDQKVAAFLAFLVISLNPLHILTSTSALTDVPHAFFVLAALYCVLKKHWLFAAAFAALAGLTRVESWLLIALIPVLQFWKERRVSVGPLFIMLLPPLFWFWVSWKAAGDWLATFRVRQQYHDWLLQQNPALQHFTFAGVIKDGAMFLSGADGAVLIAAFVAAWLVLRKVMEHRDGVGHQEVESIIPLIFFFSFFVLLTVAYLTHQQPIIFPRYGLILFSLGIPILAWTYFAIKKRRPHLSRRVLVGIIVLYVLNAAAQLDGAVGELSRYKVQRAIADGLKVSVTGQPNARVFCDEDSVRVLSGLPDTSFLRFADRPRDAREFLTWLKADDVNFLVFPVRQNSLIIKLFPDAEYGAPIGPYKPKLISHEELFGTRIWLYERAGETDVLR